MAKQRRLREGVSLAGACAATGFAAAVGLGVTPGVAGTSAWAASAKDFACYSDSTDEMFFLNYPTVRNCPSGETMISWAIAGPQGTQGSAGAQGRTGAQGAQGAQGVAGAQGAAGPQGSQGPAGSQGPQGPQGSSGNAGPAGPNGAAGPQGVQGAQGSQGSRGNNGAPGPPGPQGAAGHRGPGPVYSAYFSDRHISVNATPTIVMSISPNTTGQIQNYVDVATVTFAGTSEMGCWLRNSSIRRSAPGDSTARDWGHSHAGYPAEVTVAGTQSAKSAVTIQLVCEGGGYVQNADLVGTQVASVTHLGAGVRNRFVKGTAPLAQGSRSRTGGGR